MRGFIRPPDENFVVLNDSPYPARFHHWRDLRTHYLDVGSSDGLGVLMLHEMLGWSSLYRNVIPPPGAVYGEPIRQEEIKQYAEAGVDRLIVDAVGSDADEYRKLIAETYTSYKKSSSRSKAIAHSLSC
jgi:hypothetical protein